MANAEDSERRSRLKWVVSKKRQHGFVDVFPIKSGPLMLESKSRLGQVQIEGVCWDAEKLEHALSRVRANSCSAIGAVLPKPF